MSLFRVSRVGLAAAEPSSPFSQRGTQPQPWPRTPSRPQGPPARPTPLPRPPRPRRRCVGWWQDAGDLGSRGVAGACGGWVYSQRGDRQRGEHTIRRPAGRAGAQHDQQGACRTPHGHAAVSHGSSRGGAAARARLPVCRTAAPRASSSVSLLRWNRAQGWRRLHLLEQPTLPAGTRQCLALRPPCAVLAVQEGR